MEKKLNKSMTKVYFHKKSFMLQKKNQSEQMRKITCNQFKNSEYILAIKVHNKIHDETKAIKKGILMTMFALSLLA